MRKQDEQQTAQPAVAVEKRVDRLELDMEQRVLDEQRHLRFFVGEPLPVGQRSGELGASGRHEARALERRTWRPDPVLRRPEHPGATLGDRARRSGAGDASRSNMRLLSGSREAW